MFRKFFSISNLPIIIILLVSAFMRLYKIPDYMTFLGDEGRDVLVVYNILHGHFTLLGPTASVGGFFLGPIYYYFMAPFLWIFNYDPVGPAVMVALFGILTVWFVYKIGMVFFDRTTGIIAAFLYSVAPVVLAYSRSSWNPNLMPIFTIFTLFSLYKALQKSNSWRFVLPGIFLGILLQLHYLATFVCAIVFLYIVTTGIILGKIEKKTIAGSFAEIIKRLSIVFIGFIIGFSPFLAFEARHGFPNTISIFSFVFHSKDVNGTGAIPIIGDVFFRLFGRLLIDIPQPEILSKMPQINMLIWELSVILISVLSTAFFLLRFYKAFKIVKLTEKREKLLQYLLIFIWFFIGVLLFGFYKKAIYDYYFEFLFPLPFLLFGSLLSFLLSKKIYWKISASLVLIIIIVTNLLGIPFRYAPNRQLNQAKEISQFVLQKTQNKPYNFALITGGNSDQEYRYFFTLWNKPPLTILNPQIDPQRKSVADQLMIVCESQCEPLGNSLWEVAGFGRAEIEGTWRVSVVTVYKLKHYVIEMAKK